MRGGDARLLLVGLSIVLAGCYGADQTKPDEPQSLSGLTPNIEDKDAGLVALAPGFRLETYRVVAVNQVPVTDAAIKDAEDRTLAQSLSVFLRSELVRRLRESGLFERVINLGASPRWASSAATARTTCASRSTTPRATWRSS